MLRTRWIKGSGLLLLVLLLWFIIHSAIMIADGLQDDARQTDVAVVLGNKVDDNGQPAHRLQARLDKAADLYQQGYFPFIIVSGGVGKEGFDEAEVMKDYLMNRGIPAEQILTDSAGNNTFLTAKHTDAIMNDSGFTSVTVISQYFHITRTKLAFHKAGIENVSGAHADLFEWRDLYSIFREWPAFYKYLLFY
ncbi:YdcF family protein [Alkalihalobacillus oceani]|uniref:YdcF family protein n=1 Tax=Halalkalibacter oceani TaxID=1653776 RepID=A0A9X2DT00_9BACI|nr:YdcF family protein [Halalkalibacter oceani]MCM3714733.1 YdcF family protein [Halalkalibacter oceani]